MSNAIVEAQAEQSEPAQNVLAVIARASRDQSVDIDKMERLLQMQERVLARDAERAFNTALAEMQDEMPVIDEHGAVRGRDGKVQSRYARFEDINEVCRPTLRKYGFAINFRTEFSDGAVIIIGTLRHRAGHREESTLRLPADVSGNKNNVQAWGSSIAYGKRYAMTALLNITSRGEDNDGRGSQGSDETGSDPKPPQPAGRAPGMATDSQVKLLRAKMDAAGMSAEELCKHFNVDSVTRLPFEQVNDALKFIAGWKAGEQQ